MTAVTERDAARPSYVSRRPSERIPLDLDPQLASWDGAEQPSQLRLAAFLDHVEVIAAPAFAAISGPVAVDLVVGHASHVPLVAGGRDLDNYLYPVAQRLGTRRIAAMFGRKGHGSSGLAIGPAELVEAAKAPGFVSRLTGSYTSREWKASLRQQLIDAQISPAEDGAVRLEIALTTGPGRNWSNLWKPLIDSLGPILGEGATSGFAPRDDRITDLALHHHTHAAVGHDVVVEIWWCSASSDECGQGSFPRDKDAGATSTAV